MWVIEYMIVPESGIRPRTWRRFICLYVPEWFAGAKQPDGFLPRIPNVFDCVEKAVYAWKHTTSHSVGTKRTETYLSRIYNIDTHEEIPGALL